MNMISISQLRLIIASAALLLAATVTSNAVASEVCMNTSNGNGGSIAYYPYLFNNNTFAWNQDKSGSSECLTLNYTNGANNGVYYDGFSSNWNWPANGTPYNVKAYPSVVYGWQYGYTYGGLGLPARIWNNTNVPVYTSFNIYGSQSEDLLLDNWILTSPSASQQYAEMEVFVTDTFSKQTSGNVGQISLDNIYYYVSSRYCACGGNYGWESYSFIPNQNSTSFSQSVNMKDFVNALVYDYGEFSNSYYLGGTQAGMEIYQGSGGITFNPVAISTN